MQSEDLKGIYVLISDPAKPTIDIPLSLLNSQDSHGLRVEANIVSRENDTEASDLLWSIDRLPVGGAHALRYELVDGYFEVKANDSNICIARTQKKPGTGKVAAEYEIVMDMDIVRDEGTSTYTIEVYDNRITPHAGLIGQMTTINDVELEVQPAELSLVTDSAGRYSWNLISSGRTKQITLRYRVNKTSESLNRNAMRLLPEASGVIGEPPAHTRTLVLISPSGTRTRCQYITDTVITDISSPASPIDSLMLLSQGSNLLDRLNWVVLEFRRIERAGEADASMVNNLGCAHMWLEEWDAAEEAFLRALESSTLGGEDEASIAKGAEARKAARENLSVVANLR